MSIELIDEPVVVQTSVTKIKVIGVGGAGGNAVDHMISTGVQGVEFIAANTDAQALSKSQAITKIQLGVTGLGAGSKPEKGREAAQQAQDQIRSAIEGANMLFITAGMGGGTGTGAAPVVAQLAREMGILTVAVVTKPFEHEFGKRMANAEHGVAELQANADSLIVVLNEKLLEVLDPDVTQAQAFAFADDVLKNAVGGIAEIINVPAEMNLDFEDVRTVMGEPGKAVMGTALAAGPDRARIAAEQAVACPLLEGTSLSGAKGLLVLISATKDSLKLAETRVAMNTIKSYTSPEAVVKYGTVYDDRLGDQIRITVVATGLALEGVRRAAPPIQVVRTGTDDAFGIPQAFAGAPAGGIPTVNNVVGQTAVTPGLGLPATGYGGIDVPSVWRTNRTQATDKVNALSAGGMEDLDIPAFLRKQAD